jgi:hypothetical protein
MQYDSMGLASPLNGCLSALSAGQLRVVEHSRIEADSTVTYQPLRGQPDIRPGDQVELQKILGVAAWYEVTKTTDTDVPCPARLLYLKAI